jgi:hypothetical protein
MTGPRDWDKELAEIDKLMGPEQPRAAPPSLPAGDGRRATGDGNSARPAIDHRASAVPAGSPRPLVVWAIALLGPLGAGALAIWPYDRACNLPLGIYLVGVLAVFGASVWTMRLAWAARRGAVMVVGIVTLLAALALGAREVLPRVGYARIAATWTCGA